MRLTEHQIEQKAIKLVERYLDEMNPYIYLRNLSDEELNKEIDKFSREGDTGKYFDGIKFAKDILKGRETKRFENAWIDEILDKDKKDILKYALGILKYRKYQSDIVGKENIEKLEKLRELAKEAVENRDIDKFKNVVYQVVNLIKKD